MEQFKGTKGKWSVWGQDLVIAKEDIEDDVICIKPQIKSSQKNWEANALLISKAPEMLEMLDSIIQCSSSICNDSGEGMIIDFETFDEIQQLIKEATEL